MNAFCLLLLLGSTVSLQISSQRDDRGKSLVGTRPPAFDDVEWLSQAPMKLSDLRGKVVLIRWWTASQCPFCSTSVPALNDFAREFGGKGLVVIGLYHHKSSRPLDKDFVHQQMQRLGIQFPVGIDGNWKNLNRWWLQTGEREWTSVSFLLDREGVIRYIHPGGAYSVEPIEVFPKAQEDYQTLHSLLQKLLSEDENKR